MGGVWERFIDEDDNEEEEERMILKGEAEMKKKRATLRFLP